MSFNADSLEPHVRQILSAPGIDMTTISAKRVRRQLLQLDPTLSRELFKEHRSEVDRVISRVYKELLNISSDGASAGDEEDAGGDPDEQGDDDDDDNDEIHAKEPPKKKPRKSPKKDINSDAAYAKKLSNELNGRTRRNTASAKKSSNGSPRKGSRTAKSAATIDSDDDSAEEGASGKKRKTRSSGGGARGGFAKEYTLSEPLVNVVGFSQLSRPQVVKHLWDYIKGNSLQNPLDKREILCDDRLRALFNTDKISMFKMNKVLGQHLHDVDNEG